MVGEKIRAYREFRGMNQIQLAKLSGINVGTIRKYELGLRNPKPDQLEKIANALGVNVSIFLDFKIETISDVLSLLFAIDDSVDLSLTDSPNDKGVTFTFKDSTMQDFIRKWCQFKNVYEKEKAEILDIKDETKRQEELDKLENTHQEWKMRAMGTTIGCHRVIRKGTDGITIKLFDLT
jgi:transcriptional regulator with XRE-family HTH domain